MDGEQFKDDVRQGRIGVDRLVDLFVGSQRQLEETRKELEETRKELENTQDRLHDAQKQIDELETKLGGSGTKKVAEPYSVEAEEKRQEGRGKRRRKRKRPRRSGRIKTAEKIKLAKRTEKVFPDGVAPKDCTHSHTRCVWRLEDSQAVLVAYEVYRGPKNRYGKIPGVIGRGEFGIEISVAIAYQVYVVGLSFDKVCLLLNFFQNLPLRKSQVHALLKQLSRHWASEFDALCTLLANSLVVHTDETSWSINSVWAFLSEKARVLFFGVHKDAATLEVILNPATFGGIVISDDAAVYANFTQSQKCWAHLLRKAIKLTLLEPTNAEYRRFADRLLEIYHAARRVQRDGRLSDDGRARKVGELDDQILALCGRMWAAQLPPLDGSDNDYRLLCNELMRLMLAQQLFTFVTAAPVEAPNGQTQVVGGTNNESERTLRGPGQARDTGRGNKAVPGARTRTINVSVLESLRQYLPTFTLHSVIEEINRWAVAGVSCFKQLVARLKLAPLGWANRSSTNSSLFRADKELGPQGRRYFSGFFLVRAWRQPTIRRNPRRTFLIDTLQPRSEADLNYPQCASCCAPADRRHPIMCACDAHLKRNTSSNNCSTRVIVLFR